MAVLSAVVMMSIAPELFKPPEVTSVIDAGFTWKRVRSPGVLKSTKAADAAEEASASAVRDRAVGIGKVDFVIGIGGVRRAEAGLALLEADSPCFTWEWLLYVGIGSLLP